MLNYQNIIKTQIHVFGFRLLWWGTIAAAFTYFNISQSIVRGKLSLPPVYDDVSYLLQGAIWVNAFREGGLGELISAPIAHSPVMVLIAFIGFLLFGFKVWAPYAVNGILVFGILLGLDLLARKLPLYQRLLLPITVLTYPLIANVVMEFRPDILCSIVMSFFVVCCFQLNWESPHRIYKFIISSLLALGLLCKPSIFPITLLIGTIALSFSIIADWDWQDVRGVNKTSLFQRLIRNNVKLIGMSLILVSPYYLFGGLKYTLNYIQVVMFGANRDIWIPSFSPAYSLLYYLTGRGGWMMGAWFWVDIILLIITLATVIYRKQRDVAQRGIAAVCTLLIAYASVTIPSTKSPFLGLIVTALFLIFTYQSMVYWLEILNHWLKKHVSLTLNILLCVTIFSGVIWFQWKSFPFVGGGITLLSPSESEKYNQSLEQITQKFQLLGQLESNATKQKIFIPASTSFLNPTNLILKFQFNHIQVFEAIGLDLNRDNIDDVQTYKKKSRTADYVILARSSSVTYPSLKNKRDNIHFGEQLYQFLESSEEFERVDRQDSPIIEGEILIYRNKRPSE
jgi:hypothetical protein